MTAGLVHRTQHAQHFRRFFGRRRVPFAVEVHAGGIGAQMAAEAAIGVHVRHDVEGRLLAQQPRHRIVRIGQSLQRTFHPPFGHALARMLAGIEPHGLGAIAHDQPVNRPAIKAVAQHVGAHAGLGGDAGDQVVVPLHGVGRKIGQPQLVNAGRHLDGERAIGGFGIETGRRAPPGLPVHRHASAIARPAAGIGAVVQIDDADDAALAAPARQAEVEPLIEVAVRVLAYG